jgi:hypothetical protein
LAIRSNLLRWQRSWRILVAAGLSHQARSRRLMHDRCAQSGHSYAMVMPAFGSVPIALWTGDIAEAGRLIELLIAHTAGNQRTEQWALLAGVPLRNGNESEALVASFMEPRVTSSHHGSLICCPEASRAAVAAPSCRRVCGTRRNSCVDANCCSGTTRPVRRGCRSEALRSGNHGSSGTSEPRRHESRALWRVTGRHPALTCSPRPTLNSPRALRQYSRAACALLGQLSVNRARDKCQALQSDQNRG